MRDRRTARAATQRNAAQRYELAGPETLRHNEIVAHGAALAAPGAPLVQVPRRSSRARCGCSSDGGQRAFATWDEAELMECSMTSARGAADAEALGVSPQRMAAVLGGRG